MIIELGDNKYLSVTKNGVVTAISKTPNDWEHFRKENVFGEYFHIRTIHMTYLCAKEEVYTSSFDKTIWRIENGRLVTKNGLVLCSDLRCVFKDDVQPFMKFAKPLNDMDDLIEIFDQDGYIVFKNLLDVDNLKDKLPKESRVANIIQHDERFMEIATNHQILEFVKYIMGCNIRLSSWSSHTTTEEKEYNWHVDYPYHDIPRQAWPCTVYSSLGIQVIVLLDDFTENNGTTVVYPRSHASASCENIKIIMPKGSVFIGNASLVHTAGINTTGISRTALLANYVPSYILPKDNVKRDFENLPESIKTRHSEYEKLV